MYGQFMNAVAKRYNGKFRNPGAGPKRLPKVSHFEVWNEPNLKSFFRSGTRTSIPKYVGLVKAAYPQIKKANRKAIVIAGVGGPRGSNGNGNLGARTWLNGIVKAKGVKFDAYSQHIYPSAAPRKKVKAFPSWSSINEILKTLDKKKKGMPLYITEAGYTTETTPFRNVRVTPRQQRGYLQQLFNLKQVKQPRVPVVVWFNLQDNMHWPAGLMRADGVQEAQLRLLPQAGAEAVHPGPAQAAGPLAILPPRPAAAGRGGTTAGSPQGWDTHDAHPRDTARHLRAGHRHGPHRGRGRRPRGAGARDPASDRLDPQPATAGARSPGRSPRARLRSASAIPAALAPPSPTGPGAGARPRPPGPGRRGAAAPRCSPTASPTRSPAWAGSATSSPAGASSPRSTDLGFILPSIVHRDAWSRRARPSPARARSCAGRS